MHELLDLLDNKSTLVNAVVALLALLVSVVSVVIAVRALRIQRRHNVLSVSPLPEVVFGDYRLCVEVKVRNNGSGPLIIKSVAVFDHRESRPSVIEWMNSLPGGWTDFAQRLQNRSLLPGGEIVLLKLADDQERADFVFKRDACRQILRYLTIRVEYTDVYQTVFQPYSRSMDWFGRL